MVPCFAFVLYVSLWSCGRSVDYDSCFSGVYKYEYCCGDTWVQECWDDIFNYEECCKANLSESSLPTAAVKLEPSLPTSVDASKAPSSAAENASFYAACWEGTPLPRGQCCDTAHGERALEQCFNTEFTFERCCAAEAVLGVPFRFVGDECWKDGYDYAFCCSPGGGRRCWDDTHEYEGCCNSVRPPDNEVVHFDDPLSSCLFGAMIKLHDDPYKCRASSRFFWVSITVSEVTQSYDMDEPWLLRRPTRLRSTRPALLESLGGYCLPDSCTEEAVGAWIAPLLAPWWTPSERFRPRFPEPVNLTHVRLPTRSGTRRHFPNYPDAWHSHPSYQTPQAQNKERFRYSVTEHRREWDLSQSSRQILLTLVFPVFLVGVLECVGIRPTLLEALSPQRSLRLALVPRGRVCFDVVRLVATLSTIILHVVTLNLWLDGRLRVREAVQVLRRVNTTFTTLSVVLSLQARSHVSVGCRGVLKRFGQRLARSAPMLWFWWFVFLVILVEDVPINVTTSPILYHLFGELRDTCSRPTRLFSSAVFMHLPLFGSDSPCPGGFVESFVLSETVVLLVVPFVGSLAAPLALLLWPVCIALDAVRSATGGVNFPPSFGHSVPELLPSAFAAAALQLIWTSKMAPARRQFYTVLGGIGLAVTAVADYVVWNLPGSLPSWLVSSSVVASFCTHLTALPHIAGVVLLLRVFSDATVPTQSPEDDDTASILSLLSRLSPGVLVSHHLVIHFVNGYLRVSPLDPSLFNFMSECCATLFVSLSVSFVVLLVIQMPCDTIFASILGSSARVLDASTSTGVENADGGMLVETSDGRSSELCQELPSLCQIHQRSSHVLECAKEVAQNCATGRDLSRSPTGKENQDRV